MDRPAANKDVNWIKRGQHLVSVTTFTSGGGNHDQADSSGLEKTEEHNGAVRLNVQYEPWKVPKSNSKRINIPVVNVISKPSDNVSDSPHRFASNYDDTFVKENTGPRSRVRSHFRATSEPPPSNVTRVIPICLHGSRSTISDRSNYEKNIARSNSPIVIGSKSRSYSKSQVQGKQKIYTSGVYQECVPVRPSIKSDLNRSVFSPSDSNSVSKFGVVDKSTDSGSHNIGPDFKSDTVLFSALPVSEPVINVPSSDSTSDKTISVYAHSSPNPIANSNRVEVKIARTGNPVRVSESRLCTGKTWSENENTGTRESCVMHGGGIHSTDQRSATFVSSISVRDAAKPPPIPAAMLSNLHGGNLSDGSVSSLYWQHGSGSRVLTSPVGVSIPEQRNIIIGGQRYPAPKAPLVNTSGQSHQISVQYQSVYQSSGPSGYSSPRSSIGSGGGDSQGNSIASSPRSSLANAAALYEKRRLGGSPRSSLALANPALPNRSGWTVQMVEASSSRQVSGSPHDPRLTTSAVSMSPQHHSAANMGPKNDNAPLQLLTDSRFGEPGPTPPPPHIYTDPRQRTLPAQAQTAVSVHAPARPTSNSNGGTHNSAINAHSLQNGAIISSSLQHSAASPMSAPSPPPVLPARVPLNYRNVAQQHMLNRRGEADAEMTVAALTQQLERDMSLSSTGKKASSDPSPSEPPPPYHGPHDVQTSVKHAVVTPNQAQTSGPAVQPGNKPNVRLVAPVQGIQIQPPASMGATRSPQSRGSITSPGGGLKSQLAFNVTPPKTSGPSDAERKLAALTQQLEDEMEQTSGDYFGEFLFGENSKTKKN
ncbi:Wilms tumor protein 1-interacting-like protein [Elysia marginata]|uniref:Wilms tumor protein 1-interacting-like protein n=1 Tax=Elysia marginata TaxID=1093978 RepID=A0AAV4F9C7_9GAST|nr:Wilms tumor protein 1-interacting-like protein [Elysia marginata]